MSCDREDRIRELERIVSGELKYARALNKLYEKTISDMMRILNERGMVVAYDDHHNVINIITESEVDDEATR